MKKLVYVSMIAVIFFSACLKDDPSSQGKLSVYLTDDPSPYKAVNIDIQQVKVKFSDDSSSNDGWIDLPLFKPGVYNLLNFSNGKDTLLSSTSLSAGTIKQIRLILGPNNTVVNGNTTYTLETPSAQQSGLKLNMNADIQPGIDYKLWLDFDASRSVVTTGNGKYILKPVIRAYTQAASGSIKGVISPLKSSGWIYAIRNSTDTVGSALADTLNGNFLLPGLIPGAYKVAIRGTNNYKDTTLNTTVTIGSVTNVGTVTMK